MERQTAAFSQLSVSSGLQNVATAFSTDAEHLSDRRFLISGTAVHAAAHDNQHDLKCDLGRCEPSFTRVLAFPAMSRALKLGMLKHNSTHGISLVCVACPHTTPPATYASSL
jgi:hypothetical protein